MHASSCPSFAGVILIIALLWVPTTVFAGWPSNMDKKDKQQMQDILDGRLEIPAELGLFVKYKNAKGKRFAKRHATNNKFKAHVKKLKLVSITVKNRGGLKALSKNPHIEYVEPQHRVRALTRDENEKPKYHVQGTQDENDLFESIGYGIKMVQADKLWNSPQPKERIKVCVVDSGYGLGHPDLPNRDNNVTGTSTKTGDWFEDGYGHGTHCAGVIGAIGNNDIGVAGVLKDPDRFQLHIAKSLDNTGDGSEEDMLVAFESCVEAGAKVISMSLGSESYSQTLNDACRDAYDNDILLVAAAGNSGIATYMYPASYPQVMSVAAVDAKGKVATFSQYNDQVEIAGPGVDIVSTTTTNSGKDFTYSPWSGTSMATPYVAGIAATVWSYFPECTNNQIRNVLLRTVKDKGKAGCTEDLGYGLVQAKDAYDLLVKEGCIAGDVSPVPLSDGGIGGCSQDRLYTPPPTPAPTPFACSKKVVEVELTTDEYSEETSWELKNSKNEVVDSGDGLRSSRTYRKRLCLPADEYVFTVRDSEGDGICCDYGNGGYSVTYGGVLIKEGGNFAAKDVAIFGEINSDPNIVPPPRGDGCKDDSNWVFVTAAGKRKKCKYLGGLTLKRCKLKGVNGAGNPATGSEACPITCGSCPTSDTTQHPNLSLTTNPTTPPTPMPTLLPTTTAHSGTGTLTPQPPNPPMDEPTPLTTSQLSTIPTSSPTSSPTGSPTRQPTKTPSKRPTEPPTPPPTLQPTNSPTSHPTPSPTVQPTQAPTFSPTTNPSRPPTLSPSRTPTTQPTPEPTTSPTASPTTLKPTAAPTSQPSMSPTPYPTREPTSEPTRRPTMVPTRTPTLSPTPVRLEIKKADPTIPPSTSQPLSALNIAKVCYSDLKEDNNYSHPCRFPFNYKKKIYYSCTEDGWEGTPWCYHANGKDWGKCQRTPACLTEQAGAPKAATPNPTPVPTPAPTKQCVSDMKEDNDYSHPCGFPFEHKDKLYYACTEDGWKGTPWCYHENGKDWGKCENSGACQVGIAPSSNSHQPRSKEGDCKDDAKWTHETGKKKKKEIWNCSNLSADPSNLCKVEGTDGKGKKKTGFESCQITCNSCP